jgi:hypothetical protein
MTKRVYNQRPNVVGRNGNIWAAHIAGANQQQLADAFDLSIQRISQILDQVRKSIPADEHEEIKRRRTELLDTLKMECMEIALQDAAPAFAPNGKPLMFDGKPVLDYSGKLAAVDRLLKIDERLAKATGTDSALQHRIEVTAEAVEATKSDADRVSQRLGNLIPMSPEVAAHASRK